METGRGGVVHALSVPRVATPPTVAGKKLDPKCDLYNLYRRDGAGRISTSNNFINYVSAIDHAGDGNDSGGQSAPCIRACTGKGVGERGAGADDPRLRQHGVWTTRSRVATLSRYSIRIVNIVSYTAPDVTMNFGWIARSAGTLFGK